ncbi:MAG TPA: hypothetical protein DET40_20565 [Lentisphaeria bacterium]|nr:MAG: hypothetical protein A2X45_16200 [Lentisphaerae bacterium GWF2_50_93]HCE45946.1 hypothetical protein [Lentisphaeria bacterium]
MVETVKAISLSIMIAISGWFNDGLKNLGAGKYDEAVAELTKVYEKDVPGNKFRELALFFRAQAYYGKEDKDKACADLLSLIRMQPGAELDAEARALYLKWGGAPEKLLPVASPKAAWTKFLEVARKGDLKTALEMSSGKFRELIKEEAGEDPDQLKTLPEEIPFAPVEEKLGENDKRGTAELIFQVPSEDEVKFKMGFVHDVKNNVWLIDSIDERVMNGEIDIGVNNPPQGNLNKLKQIGLALSMYSEEYNDLFPASLEVLRTGGYLENEEIFLWKSPEEDAKFPFIYRAGLKQSEDADSIIAAAPVAVDGWREVLCIDGHVEKMDEEKFKEAVARQGWKFKGLVKKEDVPEDKQKEIRGFVKKLGDSDSNVRADSKKKLLEMGIDAFPVIEEFTNDPDPEIRIEVKNILKGK